MAFFFSWWFTRFRIGEDQIELRQGWLFRTRRQMKYDRIQAVDLQHPLVARLLGLAVVKVEAADGGESALELSFLPKARAEQVRREILDRASGVLVGPASAPRIAEGADAAAGVTPGVMPGAEAGPGVAPPGADADPAAPGADAPEGAAPSSSDPGLARRADDEGELMLQVPSGRLIGSVLLSGGVAGTVAVYLVVVLGTSLFFALAPGTWLEGEDTPLTGIVVAWGLPLAFAVVGQAWSGLNGGWGFQVRRSADGLRLRHGLTETTHQTVPPGRVQGVTVSQPLFWRPFGWHRVKVSVAGYGEDAAGKRSTALPVGPWEDVLRVLTVVAPDPGLDGDPREAEGLTPARLMHLGLHGSGTEGGFHHIPHRGRWWFNWFAWRRRGFTTTRALLVVRSGRWNRVLQTLQHERVQTAALDQGPVQRRLRLATVHVRTAGGRAVLPDLDEAVALELFAEEARHAAVSRRLADRDRWMRPEELARFEQRTREVAATEVGREELARAGVARTSHEERP
nr:PH domain-containing protein [Micrococcus endophyticus]